MGVDISVQGALAGVEDAAAGPGTDGAPAGMTDSASEPDAGLDAADGGQADGSDGTPSGCDVAELSVDSDGDGTPDCQDGCPTDPDKTDPGDCGCGSEEAAVCVDVAEWVALAAGSFDMGSTASGAEQPVHTVSVPAFDLGRSEVTVAQYRACVDAGQCAAPGDWASNCYYHSAGNEDRPVNCVSWEHAGTYCGWVGGRLPSEAEWEYAARSEGQGISYPWGDEAPTCDLAVFEDGNGVGCGTGTPWPVCSKAAGHTAQGICDMAGNLLEWVQDGWHRNYHGAPTDGSAWPGAYRFPRGGSHITAVASDLRASWRGIYFGATYQNTFLGFRCARDR